MEWTAEMSEAAELLGLDPEDGRHRALLLVCVRAAGKKRGRPKDSKHWSFPRLIGLGQIADRVGGQYTMGGRRALDLSDT
jgi:hypothetical protein